MSNYLEQVAQMRQSKQQEEIALERNQAIYGYQQSLQNRQEIERQAALTNDPDEQAALRDAWHYHDQELQRCEADIRRFTPYQPSEADKALARFTERNRAFLERHGQSGIQAFDLADRYATAPRNPTTSNPAHTGMGLRRGTRPYFEAMRSLLEMYGKDYLNVRYDRNEEGLTATEAARISGLSPERYNQYAKATHAAGRFSYQQKNKT
jgi:hypothetical protein